MFKRPKLQYNPCVKVRTGPLVEDVTNLGKLLGAPIPDNIVVGLRPWCFVTKRELSTVDGTISGSTMYISLPLLRLLSREEKVAVFTHELTHLAQEHFGLRHLVGTIGVFLSDVGSGRLYCQGQCSLPLNFMRRLSFWWQQSLERRKLSYEFSADEVGALNGGARAMQSALEKSCSLVHVFNLFDSARRELNATGLKLVNQSEALASLLREPLKSVPNRGVRRILRLRIQALRKKVGAGAVPNSADPAILNSLVLDYCFSKTEELLSSLDRATAEGTE